MTQLLLLVGILIFFGGLLFWSTGRVVSQDLMDPPQEQALLLTSSTSTTLLLPAPSTPDSANVQAQLEAQREELQNLESQLNAVEEAPVPPTGDLQTYLNSIHQRLQEINEQILDLEEESQLISEFEQLAINDVRQANIGLRATLEMQLQNAMANRTVYQSRLDNLEMQTQKSMLAYLVGGFSLPTQTPSSVTSTTTPEFSEEQQLRNQVADLDALIAQIKMQMNNLQHATEQDVLMISREAQVDKLSIRGEQAQLRRESLQIQRSGDSWQRRGGILSEVMRTRQIQEIEQKISEKEQVIQELETQTR